MTEVIEQLTKALVARGQKHCLDVWKPNKLGLAGAHGGSSVPVVIRQAVLSTASLMLTSRRRIHNRAAHRGFS
eukprot:CAMPEP_0184693118 /NCGR_PEP_ID=MMETSP0313-20130426/1406_1 /TAXON_ID=2792 /ORGANISM="Porphyridium aerugineum, Strain SAG 1380-2" /LENGTH=72 /DNA_ID=CAMNT_0027151087 /DNA_START=865 /DNA_END=1083 /DNA_ORIENTATION=+